MKQDGQITVVIADDHSLYRSGLRLLITMDGDIDVVAEAGDGREAVDVFARHQPDVLLVDLQMPRLGGVESVRAIRDGTPDARIVMLTMSEDSRDLVAALSAGVAGIVTKDSSGDEIAAAIRTVDAGQVHLAAGVAANLLGAITAQSGVLTVGAAQVAPLTLRVLDGIARGHSVAEITQAIGSPESEVQQSLHGLVESLRETADSGQR